MLNRKSLFALLLAVSLGVMSALPALAQDDVVIGMVLVGPQNDRGWSQAHFEGGEYITEQIEGAELLVFESLNPADAPETTLRDVVSEFVDQGASIIFTTSDDFKQETHEVAAEFPEIVFVHVSGDGALTGDAPENVSNLMGKMVWGKLIDGCAAALTTETGQIGYLGPLINEETRRLANSTYLGARYCYENYRGLDPDELEFSVTWIGFWFNIPGVTLDPTEESNTFFDSGVDVLISGIDTTEAIVVAGQRREAGEDIFAIPYDFESACDEAPEACLGTPYFNWGPSYTAEVQSVIDGTWEPGWEWLDPYWPDINDNSQTAIGFVFGEGLPEEVAGDLEAFVDEMATFATEVAEEGEVFLWEGPLAYQDGTVIAEEGELLSEAEIWYTEQLLEGMQGASSN
ncbi:MAG: BMP family ABC transporter substrate-binding protein [Chloroflexota bacterium]